MLHQKASGALKNRTCIPILWISLLAFKPNVDKLVDTVDKSIHSSVEKDCLLLKERELC